MGKTASRHTSAEFVGFLEEVVATAKWPPKFTSFATICQPTKPKRWQIFGSPSEGAVSLYADLFILAEPGGDLVLQS